MITDWHLLVHNIGTIISIIAVFGLGLFILINNPRSRPAIIFSLLLLVTIILGISHVIGVNVSDPDLSRSILMLNLSVFFIGIFAVHFLLALLKEEKTHRVFLFVTYAIGIAFCVFFIIYPDLFLLPSIPKQYFPNYYNPGILNVVRVIFLFGYCLPYMMFKLFRSYHRASNVLERKQIEFLIISSFIAFGAGFIPNFLMYGFNIDPLIGVAVFSLFTIPIIYAAIQFELFNIKVIAKQALFYSIGVILVGGFISSLNSVNIWLTTSSPGFPFWIIPLISSLSAMTIGVFVCVSSGDRKSVV